MSIKTNFYKLLYKIIFNIKYKIHIEWNDFNKNRKDAYYLLANHPSLNDGILQSLYLKKQPTMVVDHLELSNPKWKHILTNVVKSIEVHRELFNIKSIHEIKDQIDKNKAIFMFPEKSASYFGENHLLPLSTAKLIKKYPLDIAMVKSQGSYLANPRWGEKIPFRANIDLDYQMILTKERIKILSIEEIHNILVDHLAYNDFQWNKEQKYLYRNKHRALGLEKYIYFCPKCSKHQTIYTKGESIYCEHCGKLGHFNAYLLLSGFEFDDLMTWDKLQKQALPQILSNSIFTRGSMSLLNMDDDSIKELNYMDMEINPKSKAVFVQNRDDEIMFEIKKIKRLSLLRKDELVFEYKGIIYAFKIEDPILMKDSLEYIKKQD